MRHEELPVFHTRPKGDGIIQQNDALIFCARKKL